MCDQKCEKICGLCPTHTVGSPNGRGSVIVHGAETLYIITPWSDRYHVSEWSNGDGVTFGRGSSFSTGTFETSIAYTLAKTPEEISGRTTRYKIVAGNRRGQSLFGLPRVWAYVIGIGQPVQ